MNIDFKKGNGLVPVIVQDAQSLQVLMLGYMNEEAYLKTERTKRVTFFSRSKNRLWTKGETSNNFLKVKSISIDCDEDTLLIKAEPLGNTCHKDQFSCFGKKEAKGFVYKLQSTISERIDNDEEDSYTNQLFKRGINKVAQKVGEEAVELVIEAKDDNIQLFKDEAADLLYHYLILLKAKGVKFEEIEAVLKARSEE
jgi:phosphoribosyl-ATP pyrophosphohydrolase/phosphoribosyl-AMP cyclohydrolase